MLMDRSCNFMTPDGTRSSIYHVVSIRSLSAWPYKYACVNMTLETTVFQNCVNGLLEKVLNSPFTGFVGCQILSYDLETQL